MNRYEKPISETRLCSLSILPCWECLSGTTISTVLTPVSCRDDRYRVHAPDSDKDLYWMSPLWHHLRMKDGGPTSPGALTIKMSLTPTALLEITLRVISHNYLSETSGVQVSMGLQYVTLWTWPKTTNTKTWKTSWDDTGPAHSVDTSTAKFPKFFEVLH